MRPFDRHGDTTSTPFDRIIDKLIKSFRCAKETDFNAGKRDIIAAADDKRAIIRASIPDGSILVISKGDAVFLNPVKSLTLISVEALPVLVGFGSMQHRWRGIDRPIFHLEFF